MKIVITLRSFQDINKGKKHHKLVNFSVIFDFFLLTTVYEEIFAGGKFCGFPTEFVLREEIFADRDS